MLLHMEREKNFFFFLTLEPNVVVVTGGWSHSEPIVRGEAGMTQSPYGVMSPPRQCQTLHLEGSFKPLHLTWGMSCRQHSSTMKEQKKKILMESISAGCSLSPAALHHLFSLLTAWTYQCVRGLEGDLIGFVFSSLSPDLQKYPV